MAPIPKLAKGGTDSRAILNAVVDQANEVPFKASKADLEAEISLRRAAMLALPLALAVFARPGDAPQAFARALTDGEAQVLPDLPEAILRYGDAGRVVRLTGEDIIAPRHSYPLEPGRKYLVTFAVQRRANSPDPDNDAIRVALAWYGQGKGRLPGGDAQTVVEDLLGLTTGSGRQTVSAVVSRSAGAGVDHVAPAGARYVRPYVETFGTKVQNDVELISWQDITDTTEVSPDVSAIEARMSAQESLDAGDRLTVLEAQVTAPNIFRVKTKSDLAASTVPISADVVELLGLTEAGDGGGGQYRRAATEPSHAGKAQSFGAWWELIATDVDVRQFGAVPGSEAHIEIAAAIAYIDARGGGTVRIAGGIYTANDSINPGILSAPDFRIVFRDGGDVVAGAGLNKRVFRFDRAVTTNMTGRLTIEGARVDCSAGSSPSGGAGGDFCSAIDYNYWDAVTINGGRLYGGTDPNNNNADAALSYAAVGFNLVLGVEIIGFADAAIYPNGDNTIGVNGADGRLCLVDGCTIRRCKAVVTAKRELRVLRFVNNEVIECVSGIQANEISGVIGPARFMDVTGNNFTRCTSLICRFRGATKGRFTGNTVRDWGYGVDGTGSVTGNAFAVMLDGASGIMVNQNRFELVDWAKDEQQAILLRNASFDPGGTGGVPVNYVQGGHSIFGNTYRGLKYVYYESAGGTASTYLDEIVETCDIVHGGEPHIGSFWTWRYLAEGAMRCRRRGITSFVGGGFVTSIVADITLTAEDCGRTFNNIGATGTVVVTLPSAEAGLRFNFVAVAAQIFRIKCAATDAGIIGGQGATTSGGTFSSSTPWSTLSIEAQDSTNWPALSANGTWVLA